MSSSNVPEIKQGQSTAVLAQFDLLSMGERRGEEGREEFDLLSPPASNSLRHQLLITCRVTSARL